MFGNDYSVFDFPFDQGKRMCLRQSHLLFSALNDNNK